MPPAAARLAARFWPGPLTLVLRRSAAVPDLVTAGLATVAVRIPAHPIAHALLAATRLPVAAPSANLFSRPSPTLASHVLDDLDGRIDLVIDGGATTVGLESTILDLSAPVPAVLRPGAVSIDALREVLPNVQAAEGSVDETAPMPAPGMLSKHYSPRAPLILYEGASPRARARLEEDATAARAVGKVVGVLDYGGTRDVSGVAAGLYASLRELDAQPVDLILVCGCAADTPLGLAIRDRLRRASAGRIVLV